MKVQIKRAVLLLVLIFSEAFIYSQNEAAFLKTKRFHREILSDIERNYFFSPDYFVVQIDDENQRLHKKYFFDVTTLKPLVDNLSNYEYTKDYIVTVPYFDLRSIFSKYRVSFSFAYKKRYSKYIIFINDNISREYLNHKYQYLAEKYKIYKAYDFIHPFAYSQYLSKTEIVYITILAFVAIMTLFVIYFLKNELVQNHERSVEFEKKAAEKKAVSLANQIEKQITDPLTGLFKPEYLKDLIQTEIAKFNILEKPFSVVKFMLPDDYDEVKIKTVCGIIVENLNKDVVSAYKGNGEFVSFFSNRMAEDIEIFIELTEEKINEAGFDVKTNIFEFKGQITFLGQLGLNQY